MNHLSRRGLILLTLAAAVEKESGHPLATAVESYAAGLGHAGRWPRASATSPDTAPSRRSTDVAFVVGNRKLMAGEMADGRGVAVIGLADAVRETSAEAVA